jgi:MoxR-like ATPase
LLYGRLYSEEGDTLGLLQGKIRDLERHIKSRFVSNEEAIHITILNQLHQRSATLIRAPRGIGKSTLMYLILKGICGDDMVVISGASEVKRGEVVGRLHIPSLEQKGVERVIWAAFTKSKGKGLDEVSRLNPYTTANIHHLMQFGEVWAYGQRTIVEDYTLIANENPKDQTTFVHPPPFYDRFDISISLNSLILSEKFRLQDLRGRYNEGLIESMPQVLSFKELKEARTEVDKIELEPELLGNISLLVRDLQVCVRGKETSEIRPPNLCDGCHFTRDVCASIQEPPSERATVVLAQLAKAVVWLHGKCTMEDIFKMAFWVLSHRMTLVRARNRFIDLRELLEKERSKIEDRYTRKQWTILNELANEFDSSFYRFAREVAVEDLVFAEELMKLEETWIIEGKLTYNKALLAQNDWMQSGIRRQN